MTETDEWRKQKAVLKGSRLGRHLLLVRENLEECYTEVTEPMCVVMDRIVEKLYVIAQIGQWIMTQQQLIGVDGEAPKCLSTYNTLCNSIREDLRDPHRHGWARLLRAAWRGQ